MQYFLRDSIRLFTPAYGVARRLKEDVCLEYQVAGEATTRKCLFFKGQTLSVLINELAKKKLGDRFNYNGWFAFGSGAHRCPGEKLAIYEITYLILNLLENYRVTTRQTQEISIVGLVTQKFSNDIIVSLQPRNHA